MSGNGLEIHLRATVRGNSPSQKSVRLYFPNLGVGPAGLLAEALLAVSGLLKPYLFDTFIGVLTLATSNDFGRHVLSTPTGKLGRSEIHSFLSQTRKCLAETHFASARSLRHFTRVLSYVSSMTRDGEALHKVMDDYFELERLNQVGDELLLRVRRFANGIERISMRGVSPGKLNVSKDGILVEAVTAAPETILQVDFTRFSAVVSLLVQTEEGRNLLSAPAADLNGRDVFRLFSLADELLQDSKSHLAKFYSFKAIMRYNVSSLSNGQSFADAADGCRSRKQYSRKLEQASNANALRFKVLGLDSLKSISADTVDNEFAQATAALRSLMDTYLVTSERILREHEECVEKMDAILLSGPPCSVSSALLEGYRKGQFPSYDTLKRIASDALDWFLLSSVHNEHMYQHGAAANRGFSLSHFLRTYGLQPSAGHAFDVSLSQFYLTHRSMAACFLILLLNTGWNAGTLTSVTPSTVRQTGSGYRISGLKAKTDQLQEEEFVEMRIEDRLACRALELLLWHNHNVDHFKIRETPSIFCPLKLRQDGKRVAFLPQFLTTLRTLFRENGLPELTLRDFRTLRLNYTYVAGGGDLAAAQAEAGHLSIATTQRYLKLTSQAVLQEANVRRFMRLLGKSVRWATQGVALDDSEDAAVAKRLLFPASPFSREHGDCVADAWLESAGDMVLEITADDAIFCCYQQRYYQTHLPYLKSLNEARFLEFHLPRILFCAALHQLLKKSPFASVIRKGGSDEST